MAPVEWTRGDRPSRTGCVRRLLSGVPERDLHLSVVLGISCPAQFSLSGLVETKQVMYSWLHTGHDWVEVDVAGKTRLPRQDCQTIDGAHTKTAKS